MFVPGYLDKGVQLDEPDGGPVASKEGTQVPSMSDMLICYPTQTGYYAWRNRARGSWYIEAIVQVFMRFAKNEDICAMLNRVNYLVSRKVSECNQKEMNSMSQMSEYKSTLRRPHLFFFPGIGVSVNQ
ncbi:Caspase-2 [Bulinus truncatus]|nr:Caspase-2 [Bulinus truncatus]